METSTPATPDKKDIVLVAMKVVTKCLIYAWLLFMLVFPAIVSYMYFPEAIVAYVPYFLVIIILTIFSFLRYKKNKNSYTKFLTVSLALLLFVSYCSLICLPAAGVFLGMLFMGAGN